MKKLLLIVSVLCYTQNAFTQNEAIKFETKFYNAVDKYVVFPKQQSDSTYTYGFVYFDYTAGLTFRLKGSLTLIDSTFSIHKNVEENAMMITRLTRNTKNVHVLNTKSLESLKLPREPKWLAIYKSEADTAEYLTRLGNALNANGGSKAALPHLEKAYKIKPKTKGLAFELGYAYNALQQYKAAADVLTKAIKFDKKNYLLYKELGFAYKFLNNVDATEKTYLKGISLTPNKTMKAEMALNMTHSFFMLKQKKKFDEWAKKTRLYAKPNSQFTQYLDMFVKQWDSKR